MQIVIDIPNDHKRVIDNLVIEGKKYLLPHELVDTILVAIKNGTPLPKGHGRLIDSDKLRAVYTKPHLVGFDEIIEDIDRQPTVVESEVEENGKI